jgi:hypothetical protein
METVSYIGLFLVGYVAFRFFKSLGKGLPVLEMLLLIAGMQWILGAFIEYNVSYNHFKYYMYVDESTYMSYVVPAYALFVAVVFVISRNQSKLAINLDDLTAFSSYGLYLLGVGIISDFMKPLVPDSIQFVFFLLANFKYIGALILFFSEKKWHKQIFYLTILYLLLYSIRSGFFHDFILWSSFFYMFWAYKIKPSYKTNLIILIVGFFLSTVVQMVKSDYRELIWNGYAGDPVGLFIDIMQKRISGGFNEDRGEEGELNARLNQGWIISAILEHTPRVEPYAKGQTIKEAVFASALPRFLNPEKKIAGGVENFEKYTGIQLEKNTSMGMSLVGEAYANFGNMGMWFLGLWGFLLARFWNFLIEKSKKNIVILFFLPLIFLQVVKAETELVVVLNHIVKASILVAGVLWLSRGFLNRTEVDG